MTAAITTPRATLSPRAPHISVLQIPPDQIGLVIGSGGKTVKGIKETTGVHDIQLEDDGTVYITGTHDTVAAAREAIEILIKVYGVGERFIATITNVTDYGAFASFDDGHGDGLIHVSQIAPHHITAAADVVAIGDQVPVVIIKNDRGKIALSIKEADPDFFSAKE